MTIPEGSTLLTKEISRRNLLKKMAITGGVIATSQLIPGEWVKPIIGVGTLPAHAQGSADAAAPLTSETIVGSWTYVWTDDNADPVETGTDSAIFYADGTALLDGTDAGTWTLVGTTLTVTDDEGPNVGTVSGNADAFTFDDGNGTPTPFTRVS